MATRTASLIMLHLERGPRTAAELRQCIGLEDAGTAGLHDALYALRVKGEVRRVPLSLEQMEALRREGVRAVPFYAYALGKDTN